MISSLLASVDAVQENSVIVPIPLPLGARLVAFVGAELGIPAFTIVKYFEFEPLLTVIKV